MTFNSLVFLAFLPITLGLYYASNHRWQNVVLLIASYIFYGWWDPRFLSLLFLSTVIDYYSAKRIAATDDRRQKWGWLMLSLVTNLGALGFFKYYNFFAESTVRLLHAFGMKADPFTLDILLPVGISFYTFQTLSYTIDVFRGDCPPARNIFDFATYVSFFPQLVAGPIERATALLPQVEQPRVLNAEQMAGGLWLVALGYLKKTVIADRASDIVDVAFRGTALPWDGAENWLFIYCFAFQIYGDFAGYTDIARGLGKLMGFELMKNFRAPYLVTNPSAFWQNWHISLSTWLRDYIYIPLGGNRHGSWNTYCNLMITMLLGGIWHGAGWAYFFWGLYHGLLLIIHRLLKPVLDGVDGLFARFKPAHLAWQAALVVFFFHLTCIGWLIFRIGAFTVSDPSIDQLHYMTQSAATLVRAPDWSHVWLVGRVVGFLGVLTLWLQWKDAAAEMFCSWSLPKQVWATVGTLIAITLLGVFHGSEFIYFQF